MQVTSNGGGATGLGGGVNASGGAVPVVGTNATLVGGGPNAFGYNSTNPSPAYINVSGGTVTDLGTSNYRITLPDIQFTGGTLTSNPSNTGKSDGSGQ